MKRCVYDLEKRKQQVLEYVRANSYKYNGADIENALDIFSINELEIINGHYVGYLTKLEREGKIKYDWNAQKWYAVTTLEAYF